MKYLTLGVFCTVVGINCVFAHAVSICDIRQGIGVQPGDIVTVTGICTVPSERLGYAMAVITEDGGGPWCSIAIYDSEASLEIDYGQCVTLTGQINEYYGKYEIVLQSLDEVWDCGLQIPDPIRVPPPVNLESLEDSTVVLEGIEVLANPDEYGNIKVVDTYGTEWHMMRMIDPPPIGTQWCSMTGIIDFHFGEYKFRILDETSIDERPHTDCPWLGTACDPVTIRQFVGNPSLECFQAGDRFHYTVTWTNVCAARDAWLFIILDINGLYFFYPGFTPDLTLAAHSLPELASIWWDVFDFIYPGGAPGLECAFWAVALEPDTLNLISEISRVEFCLD
ncbi:MAG TPA: hypothetical protein PLV45_08020 [bacterium]|nr:hypothetical protein [bacterium]